MTELYFDDYMASVFAIEERAELVFAGEEPTTYTQKLIADQNKRVQKLGSEAVEFIREDRRPDFDQTRFIGEAADLVYAAEVMVAARGLGYDSVLRKLSSRMGNWGGVGSLRWDLRNYPASIMKLSQQAEALREGVPPKTEAEKLLVDPDARAERLGLDVMGLVVAEVSPAFPEVAFLEKAADVVYDTTVMVTAREVPFYNVLNELTERNRG